MTSTFCSIVSRLCGEECCCQLYFSPDRKNDENSTLLTGTWPECTTDLGGPSIFFWVFMLVHIPED